MQLLAELQAELDQRAAHGLLRHRRELQSPQGAHVRCDGKELLAFCSNDYLGLAQHPELVEALRVAAGAAGVGSGASHLISGHHALHHAAEQALAAFVRLPGALLFSTGYMANLGVVSALLGRRDAVFADKLNHASLNDAAILARADLQRYAHNDLAALERLLAKSQAKRKLVIVDAVFSMDGDIAPVPELLALCERYDALLLLDDAHGFGVLGDYGRGALCHFGVTSPRIIYMATLGKAAGVAGAFVAAESVIIDYLLQHARTYIYTTASPPPLAASLLAALRLLQADDSRQRHLMHLVAYFRHSLKLARWQLLPSQTAIQPIVLGTSEAAVQASEYLLQQGLLVPAIRPPTVPENTARLRVSLSAAHSQADVDRLVAVLHAAEREVAP